MALRQKKAWLCVRKKHTAKRQKETHNLAWLYHVLYFCCGCTWPRVSLSCAP